MSVQPQALDRNAENPPPRNPGTRELANALLRILGEGWSWDDSAQVGVYLTYKQAFRLRLEDAGCGVVRGEVIMPDRFMPQLGFERLFEEGPEVIAAEIRGPLLHRYVTVTKIAIDHKDAEEEWERATRATFLEYAKIIGRIPQVDRNTEPTVNLSAWFAHGVGDSLRIYASPGEGPSLHIYVRRMEDVEPIVRAFADLPRPKEEEPEVED